MMKYPSMAVVLLILLTGNLWGQESDLWIPDRKPGGYSESVVLGAPEEEEISYSINGADKVLFRQDLILRALPGEERHYDIDFYNKNESAPFYSGSWMIDLKKPLPPVILSQGEDIQFQTADEDVKIFYSIDSMSEMDKKLWAGQELQPEGYIDAYAVDPQGNRSASLLWQNPEKLYALRPSLNIISPPSGIRTDQPWLFIQFRGYTDIQYTITNNGKSWTGTYTKPTALGGDSLTGSVDLAVRATNMITGEEENFHRNFSALSQEHPQCGLFSQRGGAEISFPEGYSFYSIGDSTVPTGQRENTDNLLLSAPQGSLLGWTVHYYKNQDSSAEERISRFYFHDNSQPQPPLFRVSHNQLTFDLPESLYEKIHYSFSGEDLRRGEGEVYGGQAIPLDRDKASELRAVTLSAGGKSSEIVSASLNLREDKPAPPQVTLSPDGWIQWEEQDADILYEVVSQPLRGDSTQERLSPREPHKDSPRWHQGIVPFLNKGDGRRWKFLFRSISQKGVLSEESTALTVALDQYEIPEVKASLDDNRITLTGRGDLYYTLTTDGSIPGIPDRNGSRYTGAIPLDVEEDRYTEVRIRILQIHKGKSRISPVHFFPFNPPRPRIARLSGVTNRNSYKDRERTLRAWGNHETVAVRYAWGYMGDEIPEIHDDSPSLPPEGIPFSIPEGEERQFIVKLQPYSIITGEQGVTSELTFILDRKIPEKPVVYQEEGELLIPLPEDPLHTNRPITLTVKDQPADGSRIYIVHQPTQEEELIRDEITLDCFQGEEKTYTFRLMAKDKAGNVHYCDNEYTLHIDKTPPEQPLLTGFPAEGITNDEVLLERIQPEEDTQVFLEWALAPRIPSDPTESSQTFPGTMTFSGNPNALTGYNLKAVSRDQAGNWSSVYWHEPFYIDKRAVVPPPKPEILVVRSQLIMVSWAEEEGKIYYRWDEEENYKEYENPFYREWGRKEEGLTLHYYKRNLSGLQSEKMTYSFQPENQRSRQMALKGIPSGGRGFDDTVLQLKDSPPPDVKVRYRIECRTSPADLSSPDMVNNLSPYDPIFPENLEIQALPGNEMNCQIYLQPWKEGKPHGSLTSYQWIIDKKAPSPPRISGFTDGEVINNDINCSLEAPESDAYFEVLLIDADRREEIFTQGLYEEPITLPSKKGEFREYRVKAWSLDSGGNKSLVVEKRVIIDQAVVYISGSGSDYDNGTRYHPVQSIQRALQVVSQSGRNKIFIESGRYELKNPLLFSGDVTFIGGFTQEWEKGDDEKTSFVISESWDSQRPLFDVSRGSFGLQGITLVSRGSSLKSWIRNRGGALHLKDLRVIDNNQGNREFFSQINGESQLEGLSVDFEGGQIVSLINFLGGTGHLEDCQLMIQDVEESATVLSVQGGSRVTLNSVEMNPGQSMETQGILISNSTLSVENSRIQAGAGQLMSLGLRSDTSDVSLVDSFVSSGKDSRLSTLLYSEEGSLKLQNSYLQGRSTSGNTILQGKDGSLEINNCRIESQDTQEYLYLFSLQDTRGTITNCQISLGDTRDFIGVSFTGGELDFLHNTLVGGRGTNVLRLFSYGGGDLNIINNILMRKTYPRQGVFFFHQMKTSSGNRQVWGNLIDGYTLWNQRGAEQIPFPSLGRVDGAKNRIHPFTEVFENTSKGFYRLKSDSPAIDNGVESLLIPDQDWEGESRPSAYRGNTPFPDIGADEFY